MIEERGDLPEVVRVVFRDRLEHVVQTESAEDQVGRQQRAQRGIAVDGLRLQRRRQTAQDARGVLVAELLLAPGARGVLLEVGAHEVEGGAIRELPAQRGAHGVLLPIVDVVARDEVVREAVAVHVDAGDAHGHVFAQGKVEVTLGAAVLVVARLQLGAARGLPEHRLRGLEVHGAARAVPAEEGALRTAQDLHLLHVVVLGLEETRRLEVDVVHVHGDAGITAGGGEQGADAADLEVAAGEVALGEGHVRHVELEIREGVDLPGVEGRGVEGRHGDGHVLDGLGALLRGDDHFLDDGRCGRRRAHRRGAQHRAARAQQETSALHDCLPWTGKIPYRSLGFVRAATRRQRSRSVTWRSCLRPPGLCSQKHS